MKSYQEIMEVMSMKDMNKIKGGTDAQRKIAQDRQRAREAKNRGFDPKKEVLKDKPKQEGGALAKRSVLAKRKPDVRKSQLGKWSQGVKSNPSAIKKSGAIVKAKETKPTAPGAQKVDVKDLGGDDTKKGLRPGTTKFKQEPESEVGKDVVNNIKKKKEEKKKGPGMFSKVKNAIKNTNTGGSVGTSSSGDLEGLSGRNKGLIG